MRNRLTYWLGWRGHWLDMLGGSAGKVNEESYPIQDEPEGDGMLRIDHPRARSRETEPGADPGFPERQRNHSVRRRNASADLSLDRTSARSAGIPPAEPPSAGFVTQLRGEDDGSEPGTCDSVDRA